MAWDDQKIENVVSNMLRIGVLSAAILVLIGGVMYLFQHPGPIADYRHFHGEPITLESPMLIFMGALHGHARSIGQLGLLVLILTPVVRVFLCLVGFLSQRDRLYIVVSGIVLSVLIYSLVFAR